MYIAMQANPAKVVGLLSEVVTSNPKEVLSYLRQYIGNLRHDELQTFLRFVTGSPVCPLVITFNSQEGLSRRPVAHTCSFTLEISTDILCRFCSRIFINSE